MEKDRAALAGADTKDADGGKSVLIGYKHFALSENAASAIAVAGREAMI